MLSRDCRGTGRKKQKTSIAIVSVDCGGQAISTTTSSAYGEPFKPIIIITAAGAAGAAAGCRAPR